MPNPIKYTVRGRNAYQFRITRPDNGKRTTLRLGVVNKSTATEVGLKIDTILSCIKFQMPLDPGVIAWLSRIDEKLYGRFVACGLLKPREATATPGLKKFITDYCDRQVATAGWKPRTEDIRQQCTNDLVTFFGADARFSDVTAARADEWYGWLQKAKPDGRGLARATASKRLRDARQFFGQAIRHKLITENPFGDIRAGSESNPERLAEVPRHDIEKLLEHIEHPELRLIIALARFAGFRCPTEPSALRWCDVDFERKKLTVRASKTAHHEGNGIRMCPLFEELVPFFLAVKPADAKPSDFVLSDFYGSTKNCSPRVLVAIEKAKLTRWPRLFHNLRANAITDLADRYPLAQVCKWVGNSPKVAMEHYLIIRNYEYVVPGADEPVQNMPNPGSKSGTENGTVSLDQGGSAGSNQ